MLVLDVQGFNTARKYFTPKEFAAFDGCKILHFIFKQPFPFKHLPHDLQKQATWLINNHHTIPWEAGVTPPYTFATILEELTRNEKEVYVKGREKTHFLQQFVKTPINEIEEQPSLSPAPVKCFGHSKQNAICALNNVLYLYDFLNNK